MSRASGALGVAGRNPGPTTVSVTDLVKAIVAGYLETADLDRATGRSGRIHVQIEVCLDRGAVPWSTGTAFFVERTKYEGGD